MAYHRELIQPEQHAVPQAGVATDARDIALSLSDHRRLKLDDVSCTDLKAVLAWWQGLGRLPSRRDVTPFVLPRAVLPRVMIADYTAGDESPRIRLAGTGLCAELGYELKGRLVRELFNAEDWVVVRREIEECVRSGQAQYAERRLLSRSGRWVSFRRLLLPLGEGLEVHGLMSVSVSTDL